jgi:hypothetical protein
MSLAQTNIRDVTTNLQKKLSMKFNELKLKREILTLELGFQKLTKRYQSTLFYII